MRVWPGRPFPLGATWDGAGVNFALFSEFATRVELCLFDSRRAKSESQRIALPEQSDLVWHGYFPDLLPGQIYGFRVYGPYDPANGQRFNHHKLLLDPYAKAIARNLKWSDRLFGYRIGRDEADLSFDERDSAPFAPLAAVVDSAFTWGDDHPPHTPWHQTIIYEAHVKGLTRLHPDVPEKLRGTYAGIASPAMIRHFQELGITAVELMPVHAHIDDRHLAERGLANYWGYNTLGYFCPEVRYESSPGARGAVREFKRMVRTLHAAGIEVILDVVYNHTAEGNQLGPTLSLRGIDNVSYYRLSPENPRYYSDYSGCGNSLNMRSPRVLQLIMDSLRYWVEEMHVDGFRFDLASVLARELHAVDRLAAFFDIVHQDPVLSRVKLIAEPWDVGEGGYQVGNFPVLWTEWNGKYRDCVRRFWRGDGGAVAETATRLCGSSDLYEASGRRPYASINFVTCHDGFTLHDLVSYNDKHNEANGEENRDGTTENLSWNCGAEGPSGDEEIRTLRQRQRRNLLATLLISQGVPMLLGGDEVGHTQAGNNNAYCQDSSLTWINWQLAADEREWLEFVRSLVRLRRSQPTLQRRRFFQGRPIRGQQDITWLNVSGEEMTDEDWATPFVRCLGMLLSGDAIPETDERGEPIRGDTLLVLLNSHHEALEFVLPARPQSGQWELLVDTLNASTPVRLFPLGTLYRLTGRSVVILKAHQIDSAAAALAPLTVQVSTQGVSPAQGPSPGPANPEIDTTSHLMEGI